jgi:hydroxypyruvate reductase
MSTIELLAAAELPPFLAAPLARDYVVHDCLHERDPAAFAAAAPRIRGLVTRGEIRIDAALLDRLPAVEIIAVFGVGYDGVDVAAARARGILVTHTPGVLDDDVADLAMALMLCAARGIPAADRFVREGRWPSGPLPLARGVSRQRLGILGLGRIGTAVARRAAGFGMSIAYTARAPKADVPWPFMPDPVALAAGSDVLVVTTPGGAATHHLVDTRVLEALGADGILVNVSRGSVVDEAALIAALTQGTIAAAGLDVFATEPHVPESLRRLPNVVLTPHVGSATLRTREAMGDLVVANLREYFAGRRVPTPVPECAD